jgi:non-ribosomal peptide synthetase component F
VKSSRIVVRSTLPVTYEQLAQGANRLAATTQGEVVPGGVPLTTVFGYRSHTAYAAVLGALMAGHGYLPLNRIFPIDRTGMMLERSMSRSLIIDTGSEAPLKRIIARHNVLWRFCRSKRF